MRLSSWNGSPGPSSRPVVTSTYAPMRQAIPIQPTTLTMTTVASTHA